MHSSFSVLNLKMVLLTIASMVIIKSTSAVYFPPHMIIPVMPLKVVGDPYEETSKLPPRLRCPGFRRCEILEEDEERINNHLKETNCPLIPICYNRTSTTKKPATVAAAVPVNITSATGSPDINTTTTAAAPATTVAANPETTVAAVATTATAADYEPSVALAPLSPLYAVLLCPYLQRDLGDKAFVKKHEAVLKSIGCAIPSSGSADQTVAAAAPAASDKANVTGAVDQTNGTDAAAAVATNGTDAAAAVATNGTDAAAAAVATNGTDAAAAAAVATNGTDAAAVAVATNGTDAAAAVATNGTAAAVATNGTDAAVVTNGTDAAAVPVKAFPEIFSSVTAATTLDPWDMDYALKNGGSQIY